MPRREPSCELVSVRFGCEDDIDGTGVTLNELRPDRPEIRMLVGSLRDLFPDQEDSAIGVRFRNPCEPDLSRNGLAGNGTDQDDQFVDLRARSPNQAGVTRMIQQELAAYEPATERTAHHLMCHGDSTQTTRRIT